MLKTFQSFIPLVRSTRFAFSTQVRFTFIKRDGTRKEVTAKHGQHILEVAKENDVELEGACEASLACSTCHVILPKSIYQKLTPAVDE
jgi:ferredoxin